MTTATSAMSIGTGDMGENEEDYLGKACGLLNKVLIEEGCEGQYDCGFGNSLKSWMRRGEGFARV